MGALSPTTESLMVFKLISAASKTWQRPPMIGHARDFETMLTAMRPTLHRYCARMHENKPWTMVRRDAAIN
jgi:hypothetical protein